MDVFTPEIIAGVGLIASVSAAWGVAHATQAHNRAWLKDLNDELDKHVADDNHVHIDVVQRLARIETKIDKLKNGS